ncbi:MAG: hypothetical protein WD872_04075 [Pirellulaceae bacterium]
MDFRRSGQLDERRRRVLRDELAQPADSENADAPPATGSGSAKGPVRAYSAAVLDERQVRATDLLPVRAYWAVVALLLALTAVAAIECVHLYVRKATVAGAAHLAALDAQSRGSVAAWFASLLLACGAVAALVAFGIRRHRVDDYRGRYRVWLWAAAALAWGSLDAATGIHDALGLLLAHLAGQAENASALAAACTISWVALYTLVLGTLAIRLAIEVWCSLPSFAALAVAGLLYLIGGLETLGMLPESGPLVQSLIQSTLLLLAHVALVAAVGLYARHVYLDATGRLKVHIDSDKKKQAKAKPRARLKLVKDESKETTGKPATDRAAARPTAEKAAGSPLKFGLAAPAGGQPKAGAAIAKSAASSADYDEDDEDAENADDGQPLSRTERRRLKKLNRRDGQRRAA